MSYIISDESGISGPDHQRDAWGWPREDRSSYPTQSVSTFPQTPSVMPFPAWS